MPGHDSDDRPIPRRGTPPRRGTFANGMAYLTWGSGPRTVLYIQGGPGSELPAGMALGMWRGLFAPLVDAGFTVWVVTRRRHMPSGHTLADMADDYAQVIGEEFGDRVDVVIGVSLGGMIAQHLAADHPDCCARLAVVAAACDGSEWGNDVDSRLAAALARGDTTGARMAFVESVIPDDRLRWLRRLIAPFMGRVLAGLDVPPEDMVTEARASTFDTREALPRIRVPVLLLCGDRDRFFPKALVEETAAMIPDCTLVWYAGQGHVRTVTSRRVARDVLAFVNRG